MSSEKELNRIIQAAVVTMRRHIPHMTHADIVQATGAIIANLFGPFSDKDWAHIREEAATPCGQPDCGCEVLKVKLFDTLSLMRDDWRDQMADY